MARASGPYRRKCFSSKPKQSPALIFAQPKVQESSTFCLQSTLPPLPLPALNETLERYLESVRPLASPAELARTTALVEQFLGELGPRLQSLLEHRAVDSSVRGTSWLSDWWLKYAYNIWRCPVEVNSNYAFGFIDPMDANHPSQVGRAATLIYSLLEFKYLIDTEKLSPESQRGRGMDMSGYKLVFGHNREPHTGCDRLHVSAGSRHIVAMRAGQFYPLTVMGESGPLPLEDIAASVQGVIDSPLVRSPSIGAISGNNRDVWAKARDRLRSDASNVEAIDLIESALFIVCLDTVTPLTEMQYNRELFHSDGYNRWYDKMQLIVFANGAAGFNIEVCIPCICGSYGNKHSPTDGMITKRMAEYAVTRCRQLPPLSVQKPAPVTRLHIHTPSDIIALAASSMQTVEQLGLSFSLHPLLFSSFGRKELLSVKLAPDAFCQLAFQLAHYRLVGRFTAVYESAQTRLFLHGRTECMRSCTVDSCAFVAAMDTPSTSTEAKYELLHKAMMTHNKKVKMAAEGAGVDRHLLGLKLIAAEAGEPVPELFTDPMYAKTSTWNLSTSQLSGDLVTIIFGAVTEEGWGIWYGFEDHMIRMIVTGAPAAPVNAGEMARGIQNAMSDMWKLARAGKSKL